MNTQALLKWLFWATVCAVLALSLFPTGPQMPSTGWDKSNHFIGFFVLAIQGMLAYPRRSAAVFGGLLLLGGLIEGLQSLTPYRLAEWADWVADGIGIAAGQAAVFGWRHWSGRHHE